MPISTLLKAKGPRGPRGTRTKRSKNNTPKQNQNGTQNNHLSDTLEKEDPKAIRMPIPLSPGRTAYLVLPPEWDGKEAKKLLSVLAISLDVEVQVS